jgi:hypothetical protein
MLPEKFKKLLVENSKRMLEELAEEADYEDVPLTFSISFDKNKTTKKTALEAINDHLEILNDTMDILHSHGITLMVSQAKEITNEG